MGENFPQASDDQWRALIWAFVRSITEGGPVRVTVTVLDPGQ